MQMILPPGLIDFSRANNTAIDCKFSSVVNSLAIAISMEAEVKEYPLLTVAAEILLKDYIPSERLLSCYVGYAAGDDNIYPQVSETLVPIL